MPLPNPEVSVIDEEDALPPPRAPSPPPSPPRHQPKTEPDTVIPSFTDTGVTESETNVPTVSPSILDLEPEPDTTLLMDRCTSRDTDGNTIVVDPPKVTTIPRKRSREPVPTNIIDVDDLSSDEEITLLEVQSSKACCIYIILASLLPFLTSHMKDVKRARIAQYESEVVKHEVEDVKPKVELEDTKPKIEDVKPNLASELVSKDRIQATRSRLRERTQKLGEHLETRLEQGRSQIKRASDHLLALQLLRLADTYRTLVQNSIQVHIILQVHASTY